MATVEYMHICDYAFPAQNGKPGIIGIFDRIAGPAFPLTHPVMSIAVQLRGTPHEMIPFVLAVEQPNGNVLQRLEGAVGASPEGGAFMGATMVNTVFPDEGRYVVKVSSGGQTLASHSLQVTRQTPAVAAPSTQTRH